MDAYRKIKRASREGRGLLLSAEEVTALSLDDAIATRAVVEAEMVCAKNAHRKGRGGKCACQSV